MFADVALFPSFFCLGLGGREGGDLFLQWSFKMKLKHQCSFRWFKLKILVLCDDQFLERKDMQKYIDGSIVIPIGYQCLV